MKRAAGRMCFVVVGFACLCAAYGLVCAQPATSQEAKPKPDAKAEVHEGKPVSFWMQKKLDFSKNLLEGISQADFEKISLNAKTMRSLNRIESFVRRRNTPSYRAQADFFDQSLEEIIRQADKENVEGVTLAFNQLTVSCVSCHKQLREQK